MRGFPVRPAPRRLALAGAVLLAAGGLAAVVMRPAAAATATTVSVDAGQALRTIDGAGVGMNVAVWDAHMNEAATSTLLSGAGVKTVRYPGGGYSDGYHWQTHTVEGGGYVAANTEFDPFVAMVHAAGAQPIITANYGSGTPQEAADWVRYANVTKGYGIKYWEIGNELYGNGLYGATWETDKHDSHTATTYATNVLQFVTAMKAVDPTIKIGAVLTTPGAWPDGIVGPGDTQDWNHTVLSIAGSKIDFGIVHHYPYSTSESELLTKPQTEIPTMMNTLKSLAPNLAVAVTEANSQYALNTSPSGLYTPDMYLTWMEQGAFNVDWWNMRNGTDCSKVTTIQGATDYNDGSIVSSGASCEPAVNTPFPSYYGLQMLQKLGGAGDTLVRANSSSGLLSAHAVKKANGDVSVMLINKDPSNDATVSLNYAGFTPAAGAPTVYSYLKNATAIGSASAGTAATQTVPAYSIAVVQLHKGSGTTSASPSASPSRSTSTSASPSAPAGTCRVTYTKQEWQGGLVATVTIANPGTAAINGWRLTYTFPGDTKVGNAWNATVTQSGAAVTAVNASYNAVIPPGGSTSFGFQGSWTANDASPASFALNGSACAS
ncbi:cellulose binding domain-containing protein [Dactylosporangium sp. NPDC049140]|uniref:cellulose binding domain-containing protein n=1 Tax=Dactylosporangium sp. NPDC049140 TaxID=3155647 RepID=UPI0033EC4A36